MNFYWYRIFNLAEFLATELVSRVYELDLARVGLKKILTTNGNVVSITYEDVMLSVPAESDVVFSFEGYAIYLHPITGDVHLGLPIP